MAVCPYLAKHFPAIRPNIFNGQHATISHAGTALPGLTTKRLRTAVPLQYRPPPFFTTLPAYFAQMGTQGKRGKMSTRMIRISRIFVENDTPAASQAPRQARDGVQPPDAPGRFPKAAPSYLPQMGVEFFFNCKLAPPSGGDVRRIEGAILNAGK